MLLMVEKRIGEGICQFMDMLKLIANTWKIMMKI